MLDINDSCRANPTLQSTFWDTFLRHGKVCVRKDGFWDGLCLLQQHHLDGVAEVSLKILPEMVHFTLKRYIL